MIGIGLRQLQEALDRKAGSIQREFVVLSDQLDQLSKQVIEARGEEVIHIKEEQNTLRERQRVLAEEVNLWRDRAAKVTNQVSEVSLRAFLEELQLLDEPLIKTPLERALYVLEHPEEAAAMAEQDQSQGGASTPAGRLIERARSEYDMRGADRGYRLQAAIEFSNRTGLALKDEVLAEVEAALEDQDPIVREVALLATIQLHRFRAMRVADLDRAHESVKSLTSINDPAVIPVLIEITANPRLGFTEQSGQEEVSNSRSRLIALLRLVEWHTAEAYAAVRARMFDSDSHIVRAAERAIDLFPSPWNGPLKK